jgi:hypothetical protein
VATGAALPVGAAATGWGRGAGAGEVPWGRTAGALGVPVGAGAVAEVGAGWLTGGRGAVEAAAGWLTGGRDGVGVGAGWLTGGRGGAGRTDSCSLAGRLVISRGSRPDGTGAGGTDDSGALAATGVGTGAAGSWGGVPRGAVAGAAGLVGGVAALVGGAAGANVGATAAEVGTVSAAGSGPAFLPERREPGVGGSSGDTARRMPS